VESTELPGVSALEIHRSLSSTNERARAWIREGVEPVAVVVAAQQTRGRGRGGSHWVSGAEAGLWMSAVVEGGDPERDRLLPLRVGLALAAGLDAMPARAHRPPIRLKWPNDVFSDRGKVGGILCESFGDRVVVGIGLNCSVPEVESDYPVAGLIGLDAASLLPVATTAVVESADRKAPGLEPSEVAEWRRRDLLAGTEVEAAGGVRGRALGVDRLGRLLVAEPGRGIRAVISGSARPVEANFL